MRSTKVLTLALALALTADAESPVITGVDYQRAEALRVAPGQIVTLTVRNIRTRFPERLSAQQLPLPTVLGGLSVHLRQSAWGLVPIPVPLLAIETVRNACSFWRGTQPCGEFTAVTVQIPMELIPNIPISWGVPPNQADLTISIDGVEGEPVRLDPVDDSIHVLHACNLVFARNSSDCGPLVMHADGTRVTAQSPASGGEVLTMYAVGLGTTEPLVATGTASPDPIRLPGAGLIDFDFTENAAPRPVSERDAKRPLYVGLVPNFVGLYQINFRLPPIPVDTPTCSLVRRSNVTVSFALGSYGGGGICAKPSD